MNKTQIALCYAFDAAMDTMCEIYYGYVEADKTQLAVAYGGALALCIIAKQNTDAKEVIVVAEKELNLVAKYLGLPCTP